MSECKYDRDKGDYLTPDGKPCRHDSYGDPTRHCTARRTCSQHIGPCELTCARCIGRVRQDIRAIRDLSPLLPVAALGRGVNSEAANLAWPAADHRVFEARRAIARAWIYDHIHKSARGWCKQEDCQLRHFKTAEGNRWHRRGIENALADLLPDDDEHHPYGVLTRWQVMLSEDYSQPLPDVLTITSAATYLDRNVNRVAQDETQDFPLLAREVRTCRQHLEAVLHNSQASERGAPCPECETFVRLVREFGHWVDEGEEKGWRLHYRATPDPDDEGDHADRWVCPKDRTHWWSERDYRSWVEERTSA